jgi:hypothetical protein
VTWADFRGVAKLPPAPKPVPVVPGWIFTLFRLRSKAEFRVPENWPLQFPPNRTQVTWRELAEYNQSLLPANTRKHTAAPKEHNNGDN